MPKFYKKIKRKKTIKIQYLIVVIMIMLVSISFAYSYFSSELKILGNVSSPNDRPPIEIVPDNPGGEGGEGEEGGESGGEYITPVEPLPDANITSQSFENNTLTINYKINLTNGTPRATTISTNIVNNQVYNIQNGTTSSQTAAGGFFQNTPNITLDKTVLAPGEKAKLTITFTSLKFNKIGSGQTYRATVSYATPTGTYEIYIVINFSR